MARRDCRECLYACSKLLTCYFQRAVRVVDQIVHQRQHIVERQRLQLIGSQTENGQSGHTGEHATLQRMQMIVAQVQNAQIVEAVEGAL